MIFPNPDSYSGFQLGEGVEYSSGDLGQLRVQDVGEGSVKIRCSFDAYLCSRD